MKDEVEVVEPRDETDRTIVRRAHVRLFQETLPSIDFLTRVRDSAELAKEKGTAIRVRAALGILERTAAKLHRIDATAAMMLLPMASGEVAPTASEEDRVRAESLQVLRGILARLDEMAAKPIENGNASEFPGLVLLRRADAGH